MALEEPDDYVDPIMNVKNKDLIPASPISPEIGVLNLSKKKKKIKTKIKIEPLIPNLATVAQAV